MFPALYRLKPWVGTVIGGSFCTFIYLAYVYVKSCSVWVASFAHIVMNNSGMAFSYFVTMQSQLLANVGLTPAMVIVAVILYRRGVMRTLEEYFRENSTT